MHHSRSLVFCVLPGHIAAIVHGSMKVQAVVNNISVTVKAFRTYQIWIC